MLKALHYDPIAISLYYRKRPWQVWARQSVVIWAFLNFGLLLGWDWLTGCLAKNQQRRAIWLRHTLTRLGATFIKSGQILSIRPDLIPPIYLEELTNLQDQLPPFANELAYDLIESELGCPYSQIYPVLSPKPVAAASLGQVYKGQLKSGEIVAVKVQRPHLREYISLDIYIVRQLTALVQPVIPVDSDLLILVDELANSLFEEIDYINEGRNAQRFARLYQKSSNIVVPRIYWRYTSYRILTMEWIEGTKITNTKVLEEQGLDPAQLVSTGYQFALEQLLEGGLFHADPHPGNLLVTPEGNLAYLDFGMLSEIDYALRNYLIASLFDLLVGDFDALARDYVLLGYLSPDTDLNPLIPRLAEAFGNNIRDANVTEFGFKQNFERMLPLFYEYSVRVPAYYLLMFRCFGTLEGIALKVNPNLQAFKLAYPYLVQRLLIEQNSTLKACLNRFLVKDGAIAWEKVSDFVGQLSYAPQEELPEILTQGIEFLSSPQGKSVRHGLIKEMAFIRESLTENAFRQLTFLSGFKTQKPLQELPTLVQSQSLWNLIQNRSDLIWIVLNLFRTPETQRLIRIIIEEWGMVAG
ncbi:MAG: AarF/ABC1/UbiB kinase family protein [Moorea sp. SIO2B7]|nr:AarF/ABC1/UbiB kinase family protein [Moorena sp. SIO2B7]